MGVILLQIGLKCLSMMMTLDLLHEFANTEVVCLFHNCMWQSRHSEINVNFLALCGQIDGLFTFNGSPFLHDLRLRFRLRLCLDPNVQQTLAHNSGWMTMHSQVSPFLSLCFRSQTRHLFDLLSKRTRWLLTLHKSLRAWQLVFGFWLDCWESSLPPSTSEPNSFTQFSLKEIFGGSRGDIKPSRKWFLQLDDCIRSSLIECQSFLNRNARMCNRHCLHSSMIGMLSTAS